MTETGLTVQALRMRYPDVVATELEVAVGAGWMGILDRLFASVSELVRQSGDACHFRGAESSHGRLKLDYECDDRWDYALQRLVLLAEFRSRSTCETCGAAGHLRLFGWRATLCDDHASTLQKSDTARPAWTLGRETIHGYFWYDPDQDDAVIVEDLASIGMPASSIATIMSDRETRVPRSD